MGTSRVISPIAGVQFDPSDKTVKRHELGTQIQTEDGNVLEYVRANGAIDQYDLVIIDEAHDAQAATTTISGDVPSHVGAAQVALADNEYGWVVRQGRAFTVNAVANSAIDVKLYTSATPGHCDDAPSSGDLILGLRLNVATASTAGSRSASAAVPMMTNSA